MNIGIDLRTLMSGSCSGIPGFTHDLISNILLNDTQNNYFGFYNSYKDIKLPELGENIDIKKLDYPNKLLNLSMKYFKYPKMDKIIPSDIFYMPHFNFNSLSNSSLKIITVHDLSFVRYPEFFSHKNNLWHKFIEVRKTLQTFDIIIAISKNTKNDLIELFNIPEEKIKVIYSGINERFKPIEKNNTGLLSVKQKYKLPEKFILSLGTIEPRKNIDSLIKAFDIFAENNNDYYLVIAGGLGWKYKSVLNEFKRAKNKNRIIFLGYVDEIDKNAIYNLAEIFAFPSYYEGFGFPPLEAMKAGTPVIASNNSSMLETLNDSAYFIDPYNISDLADAILDLSSNYRLKENLIIKGVENCKKFNWHSTSISYISLFSDELHRK